MSRLDNNLFNYATSELSQDAFICWLASYALVDEKGTFISDDIVLRDCAKQMLMMFVPEFEGKEFRLVKIDKQKFSVDVLFTVVCETSTYKIIVEDKTYTSQHDNQLLRYKEKVRESFPGSIVKGVYYKTWFQSDLRKVFEAEYQLVMREDVLLLMSKYLNETDNQIFKDYFDYWNYINQETKEYNNLPTKEWDYTQVFGFYEHYKRDVLEKRDMYAGYGYVANPTGGFDGLWFGKNGNDIVVGEHRLGLYLQINATYNEGCDLCVCLKIESLDVPANLRSQIRNQVIYSNFLYDNKEFGVEKPARLGNGVYMTIGIYNGGQREFSSYIEFENFLQEVISKYEMLLDILKNKR